MGYPRLSRREVNSANKKRLLDLTICDIVCEALLVTEKVNIIMFIYNIGELFIQH